MKRIVIYINFLVTRKRRTQKEAQLEALLFRIVNEENRRAGLFDEEWYAATYPDVANEGMDAFSHYVRHGYKESRNPGPEFDNNFWG